MKKQSRTAATILPRKATQVASPRQAAPIPPFCDGTVQTECMLGDSGWTVTIPPHVTIKLMGFDRPSADFANARVTFLISSHLEAGHYFNPHAQRIMEGKVQGSSLNKSGCNAGACTGLPEA